MGLRPERVVDVAGVGLVVVEGAEQDGVAGVGLAAGLPGGGVVDVAEGA
jgi:hypothetical protein